MGIDSLKAELVKTKEAVKKLNFDILDPLLAKAMSNHKELGLQLVISFS